MVTTSDTDSIRQDREPREKLRKRQLYVTHNWVERGQSPTGPARAVWCH